MPVEAKDVVLPEGREWVPVEQGGGFLEVTGPIFQTMDHLEPTEPARFGFRVLPHHCNRNGICHGGMLATFVDLAMGRSMLSTGRVTANLPTISMTLDFLSGVRLDEWVETRVVILRETARLAFIQAVVMCGTNNLLRCSGVYRITQIDHKGRD